MMKIAPYRIWFADSFKDCQAFATVVPEQRLGAVPMNELVDDCRPDLCHCTIAFGNINDTGNEYENDTNAFLFDFPTASGNNYRIEKYDHALDVWVDVAAVASYGTVFGFGSFPVYPRRSGFVINWGEVIKGLGIGFYRFAMVSDFDGTAIYSGCFNLRNYDCLAADHTIRITSTFNGRIGSLLFRESENNTQYHDLREMTWTDQCRYYGSFNNSRTQKTMINETRSTERRYTRRQSQDRIFDLEVLNMPADYVDRLEAYILSGQTITVNDYTYASNYRRGLSEGIEVAKLEGVFERQYNYDTGKCIRATTELLSRYNIKFDNC